MTVSATSTAPGEFDLAVAGLASVIPRREIVLGSLPAPARLAPFSHAISATLYNSEDIEVGSGRLVLLHDPNGVDAWDGTLRIVIFATCELENEVARDPLLPEVAWSWLVDAVSATDHTALGGTVTATASTRFGDISGPEHADDLEVRASWTPRSTDTAPHLAAFLELLSAAAGLPPEGVSAIRGTSRSNA
ncbi:DUF3000 domain-containing protein [Nakamurella lactea]|uniref:DUF3000 domain-containing protein n=1 Tax=Nakamurella lactea TaxID=459515 RepID=UPI0003FAB0AD|nr:DUF3000 domain-containing protein [Nakamurella lactea]